MSVQAVEASVDLEAIKPHDTASLEEQGSKAIGDVDFSCDEGAGYDPQSPKLEARLSAESRNAVDNRGIMISHLPREAAVGQDVVTPMSSTLTRKAMLPNPCPPELLSGLDVVTTSLDPDMALPDLDVKPLSVKRFPLNREDTEREKGVLGGRVKRPSTKDGIRASPRVSRTKTGTSSGNTGETRRRWESKRAGLSEEAAMNPRGNRRATQGRSEILRARESNHACGMGMGEEPMASPRGRRRPATQCYPIEVPRTRRKNTKPRMNGDTRQKESKEARRSEGPNFTSLDVVSTEGCMPRTG